MSMNLASKYSQKIDERFTKESQALMATNKEYEWTGVNTINVYQIDTVPLTDYTRSGNSRYGTPSELGNTIQSYTISQDKSFAFTIDKGNKTQTMMVMDAGKSLAREQREVIIPYMDKYIFGKMIAGAIATGQFVTTAATTSTAYAQFLKGMEVMSNELIPDVGRVAFCTYGFANMLMQDPAFMKYSDRSQEMVIKGVLGEVDGCKIVKVPSGRLPYGAGFLIAHQSATIAPEQLKEYKTHDNPPGISGWLVEGRIIHDCFILEGKKKGLYYGSVGASALGTLTVTSAAGETSGKTTIAYSGLNTNGLKVVYSTAKDTAPACSYGTDVSAWTDYTAEEFTPTATHNKVTIALSCGGVAVAAGSASLTIAA